jgi:putative nucleotidyltransferase with HDIG domain
MSAQIQSLREELFAKAEALRALPTLAVVSNRLFVTISDSDSSLGEFLDIATYDQAVSAKIISIANSAYYGRGLSVVSLKRAMTVIGLEEAKKIVMCLICLNEAFCPREIHQRDLATLWMHSLAVGHAAQILCRKTMVEDPEKAYAASIFHDIGKIIFYTYGDQYRQVAERSRNTGRDLCSLEREVFGTDHQEVGCSISTRWRFPDEFSAVIRGHHAGSEGWRGLPYVVRTADRFVNDSRADLGAEGLVLQKETAWILAETKRISELLGVTSLGI